MVGWRRFGRDRYPPPGDWVQATTVQVVAGTQYRRRNAWRYCEAVESAESRELFYGVTPVPEPTNRHDPHAIAIFGHCEVKPLFRKPRHRAWHVGYMPRELAAEMHAEFLSVNIPIAAELYEIFIQGNYLEIKFIVLAPPGHSLSSRKRRRN